MDWVIDASMALAWALPDETSKEAERFLGGISVKTILWVTALWWYEMANALLVARRRKRLKESDGLRLMELYRTLPIRTDRMLDSDTMLRFQTLGMEYHLSAYDAAYLELAQRRGLGLATVDRPLRSAARNAGIRVTLQA